MGDGASSGGSGADTPAITGWDMTEVGEFFFKFKSARIFSDVIAVMNR